MSTVDTEIVRNEVQGMYERVASEPQGEFHFEMGRVMAERLGYSPADLDRVPAESIESFAGVGYHFGLAKLAAGERVLDLGSGSGLDTFVAALHVGTEGGVVGIDFTEGQRDKASRLRDRDGFGNVSYVSGLIEKLPFADGSFDCVVSNGVINLVTDKDGVFREAARVLKPGGRLALSDIVTAETLPESVVCNANLWAACIGGAMQRVSYQDAIERAGFRIEVVQKNDGYHFISERAMGAQRKWGVQSVSLVAVKQ
jgi:ubiquinone/menaquinone biosynthesis C-methylase UbiE